MTESTPAPDEPPTALPPPAVIRVLTINVQGGLTPNLSHAYCTKDKLARACDFLDAGYVCVCAQECGFLSDSPPPSVSAYLLRRGASIRCVGRRRGGEASVAILLAPGWHFTKAFRYECEIPTAGCIGAEITSGTHAVFVASIKLPPSLDSSCDRWETNVPQRASRRLAARVMEWASPYRLAFICGDLNTTASCCLDRPSSCHALRPGLATLSRSC